MKPERFNREERQKKSEIVAYIQKEKVVVIGAVTHLNILNSYFMTNNARNRPLFPSFRSLNSGFPGGESDSDNWK